VLKLKAPLGVIMKYRNLHKCLHVR